MKLIILFMTLFLSQVAFANCGPLKIHSKKCVKELYKITEEYKQSKNKSALNELFEKTGRLCEYVKHQLCVKPIIKSKDNSILSYLKVYENQDVKNKLEYYIKITNEEKSKGQR